MKCKHCSGVREKMSEGKKWNVNTNKSQWLDIKMLWWLLWKYEGWYGKCIIDGLNGIEVKIKCHNWLSLKKNFNIEKEEKTWLLLTFIDIY